MNAETGRAIFVSAAFDDQLSGNVNRTLGGYIDAETEHAILVFAALAILISCHAMGSTARLSSRGGAL